MSRKLLYRLIFAVLLVFLWEFAAHMKLFPPSLFPSVEAIVKRFMQLIKEGQLLQKTAYSILIVLVSMLISLVISTMLIIISKKHFWIETNVEMIHSVVSPLPGIAILPIVILWFGIDLGSMIFIIVHATIWPMWRQLGLAVKRLSARYSRFETAFRLSKFTSFYHIYFLGIRQELVSALSVSWSRGWRALISVEMLFGIIGKQSGLGWLIYERRMYMDTEGLYAGLLAIALCGILFESLVFKPRDIRRSA